MKGKEPILAVARARPRIRRTTVQATVVRVVDADTLVVRCELPAAVRRLGFHVRLAGVNAAERGTVDGDAAKAEIQRRVVVGATVKVTVEEVDPYGRWIATVKLGGESLSQVVAALPGSVVWSR